MTDWHEGLVFITIAAASRAEMALSVSQAANALHAALVSAVKVMHCIQCCLVNIYCDSKSIMWNQVHLENWYPKFSLDSAHP